MKNLDSVLVGNLLINPAILRELLKKISRYWLNFDKEKEIVTFNYNNDESTGVILEIRNISYESAVKLAAGLGLQANTNVGDPTSWSKWNPTYRLHSNGSEQANILLAEIRKHGIPVKILSSDNVGLSQGNAGIMFLRTESNPHGYSLDQLFEDVTETAKRHQEALATTP